jgi:predicted porin
MRKSLLAVLFGGMLASPAALAQTPYGVVDLGYQHAKHADGEVNKQFIESGQHSGSRIGVRGTEDLAAATYATYTIEFDVIADTGATSATGMTSRLTFVGLGSKAWGELTLGRQYTRTYDTFATGSASGYGTFTSFLIPDGPGITSRVSNSVKYVSPSFGGLSFGAVVAPGESTAVGASDNGNYLDYGLRWSVSPFGVAASRAVQTAEAGGVESETKLDQIVAHWDNRAFGLYGGYVTLRNEAAASTLRRRAYWFNPVARVGDRHELFGLWGKVKNTLASNADATVIAVTHQLVLSKRTRVYTSLGKVKNQDAAAVELNAFAAAVANGYDPRGFQLGLLHSF